MSHPFQGILVGVLEIYPFRGRASLFHQQIRIQSSLVKLMSLYDLKPPYTVQIMF